ncbi:hypothetical protein NSMM_380018 [Nitrosomonas mobilis]|uniref:Uncharacterized protein n=1 Tax=Nitrosomonas mobilis TaxID=51642 RepID=A0A1G5SDX3_9PROT|nr:hypothetical protein NSMM_380018 [Nitrosomonas mobilis]
MISDSKESYDYFWSMSFSKLLMRLIAYFMLLKMHSHSRANLLSTLKNYPD